MNILEMIMFSLLFNNSAYSSANGTDVCLAGEGTRCDCSTPSFVSRILSLVMSKSHLEKDICKDNAAHAGVIVINEDALEAFRSYKNEKIIS